VAPEPLVLFAEDEELCADGLDERGDTERLLDTRGGIAHAELDRGEERVRPQIPPDLPAVVDRSGLHEKLDEVLVLVVARELRRRSGARSAASVPRRVEISARASLISAQILVPASMTDCIISGLICSPRRGRAAARSVSLWLLSCPSESTIWNSSSIPMVRRGTLDCLIAAEPPFAHR